MRRWVVLALLAGVAAVPGRAMAAECAAPGVPGEFDVFVEHDYSGVNTQVQGRAAAGGAVSIQSFNAGNALPRDPNRVDLIVGGNLAVGSNGAGVWNGGVTYGGTLTPTNWNSTLTLSHEQPPFDFGREFGTLRERSAQWRDLPANGSVSGPTYGTLTLTGSSTVRNVFTVSAERLESSQQVQIQVPDGATVLINVPDISYTNKLSSVSLTGTTAAKVLWNFPLATSVTSTVGLAWQGSILAPNATVTLFNGQLNGSVAAAAVSTGTPSSGGYQTNHVAFTGCLPPAPAQTLSLESLCTDPQTNHHAMRLRNTGESDREVTWIDRDSAQRGRFIAPAGTDTFFDVLDGNKVHHIVATSGSTTLEATTTTRRCAGTITVGKRVTGDVASAPAGPWRIHIDGDNRFSTTRDLRDGEQAAVAVPGSYKAGSVPIGQVVNGVRYVVSEPDPLGAVATVDNPLITVTDGQSEVATVSNEYTAPTPPEPEPEPPVPPQPVLPPGPTDPLPGPDLMAAASLAGGADVAVTETISPRVSSLGDVVNVTVRVRNKGPLPAVDALAREIPLVDPKAPNQVARILSVKAGPRAAGCTHARPVRCGDVTLPAGAEAVIRVRARMLQGGIFRSVVLATSKTPDPNTTNNLAATGLVVRRPANVAVAVSAPAATLVGVPVAYRVVVRGTGSDGAESVRFCHRVPAGLLMTSAPGTFRFRGRVCRDVTRLRAGQRASFTVHAIAAARAAGRTLALRATASAPDAATALGSARIAVIAQSFAGTGRG
jgi:choice-of-anchor A domain-containing protein